MPSIPPSFKIDMASDCWDPDMASDCWDPDMASNCWNSDKSIGDLWACDKAICDDLSAWALTVCRKEGIVNTL